jgi:hypothetical protein
MCHALCYSPDVEGHVACGSHDVGHCQAVGQGREPQMPTGRNGRTYKAYIRAGQHRHHV